MRTSTAGTSIQTLVTVGTLLAVLSACSGDDSPTGGSTAGISGTSGTSGATSGEAGNGGSTNDGGTAGTSSGSAGSSTGGTSSAGTSAGGSSGASIGGSAGSGGNGGNAGDAGTGGVSGSAGTAGVSGAAGQAGGPLTGAGHVRVQDNGDGSFGLLRDDQPYVVHGIGGQSHLDRATQVGANSVRTWGSDYAGPTLDEARDQGMTVLLGIWLSHDAGSYDDDGYKNDIRGQLQALLDSYKDHPALLMWALGNEINSGADTDAAWSFVNELAGMVHAQDPNHPAVTVIAGANGSVMNHIAQHAPGIDVLGINSYGGVTGVGTAVAGTNFHGPYMVTEWGPNGHWEVPSTSWGAPIEQSSAEKADSYESRWNYLLSQHDRCLGSYVFLWGQKEERTPTWYGLFAEERPELGLSGQGYPPVDVMQHAWTGSWPSQRAPHVETLHLDGKVATDSITIGAGQSVTAHVDATDPEGDSLTFTWELLEEATNLGDGGSPEPRPDTVNGAISGEGAQITLTAPGGGNYRLYVYAFDGHGGVGTSNTPFHVP